MNRGMPLTAALLAGMAMMPGAAERPLTPCVPQSGGGGGEPNSHHDEFLEQVKALKDTNPHLNRKQRRRLARRK